MLILCATFVNGFIDQEEWTSYYPLNEDMRWVYDVQGLREGECVIEAKGKEKRGNDEYYIIQQSGFDQVYKELVRIDSEGVKSLSLWNIEFGLPWTKLKFPIKLKEKWEDQVDYQMTPEIKIKISISSEVSEDEIKIAAISHKCFKVTSACDVMGLPIKVESWYGKDFGMLRMVISVENKRLDFNLREFGYKGMKLGFKTGDRYTYQDDKGKELLFECAKTAKSVYEFKHGADLFVMVTTSGGFQAQYKDEVLYIPYNYEKKDSWIEPKDKKTNYKLLGYYEIEIDKSKIKCARIEMVTEKNKYEILFNPSLGLVRITSGSGSLTLKSVQSLFERESGGCKCTADKKCKCGHCAGVEGAKCYCNTGNPPCGCGLKMDKCKCGHCSGFKGQENCPCK